MDKEDEEVNEVKLTIIGWYGTETIGDRAILAGLISRISALMCVEKIFVGSLNPFFTERTIYEDKEFINKISSQQIDISCFNSKNVKELKEKIIISDLLIMGGGPIMEIKELFMIEYAFQFAKKQGKMTALMGCGFGPLYSKKYKSVAVNILENSDTIIFRDLQAKKNAEKDLEKYGRGIVDLEQLCVAIDPAVHAAFKYLELNISVKARSSSETIINLRKFPDIYLGDNEGNIVEDFIVKSIKKISEDSSIEEIVFVPMHCFRDGNDDRDYLNQLVIRNYNKNNIKVQNRVLTLEETFEKFYSAKNTIGMRFHSVVLMTILNKNNYIFDYTDPDSGKIIGFLRDIDKDNFYKKRYISLHKVNGADIILWKFMDDEVFNFDKEKIEEKLKVYDRELLKLISK